VKISYDGPPDFGNETITIKIELQPSEVADVVRKLIGPGAVELVREQLPPEQCTNLYCSRSQPHDLSPECPLPPSTSGWKSGGGAGQWNG
jgi:hypothetical protein